MTPPPGEARGTTAHAVIARYFAAVDAGNVDTLLTVFHDDVVYDRPGYEPMAGRARLRSFYESDRVIRDGAHAIEGIVVDGERAAAWGSFDGMSHDGAPLRERWADVYTVRDGLVAYRRTHFFRPAI